ncbi:MAG TPA: TIGR01777 family oxidoreductase [Gaiellaceae bacterium]|nr:TIGR01777 family oxidoreductase [Gaiellaceae bacterium]
MRIVVSAASSMIGTALVPALREDGHEVVRLVRREAQAADEIAWDPANASLDPAALAGVDAVVNLSGANIGKRWTKARKREIRDSRVQTTGLLAGTIAKLDPPPSVLVSAGAVGIYGNRGDEILTEESELATDFPASVLVEKEAAADPARAAGIRVVDFRQGIVLSTDGGALARMLPFFKLGVGGRVGNGKQWWSWVGLDDVVAAYRFALEGELEGPVNVAAPNLVRSIQFVKTLGRVLGRPTIFPLPALGVRTLWGEMGENVLLEGQRALPARLLDAGFTFAYPELDAALERALSRS